LINKQLNIHFSPNVCDHKTANYFKNAKGSKQSLQVLAADRLGIKIQTGEHSPVVDARAALRIYVSQPYLERC